jgi:chorismate dehydratase
VRTIPEMLVVTDVTGPRPLQPRQFSRGAADAAKLVPSRNLSQPHEFPYNDGFRGLAENRTNMSKSPDAAATLPLRIGAVNYLNAKPLIVSLAERAPQAEIIIDLPSRLADALRAGQLDVAMIPSIEYARQPGCTIVSNACIACDGVVRSVKLYGRVPVERIGTLALDEGSRTSAALARIVLKERYGLEPAIRPLPIGASADEIAADALVLIGDRGMLPAAGEYEFVWDLGEEWSQWTGLPFVFAMWIARPGVDLTEIAGALAAARDDGITRFAEIARTEAPGLGLSEMECLLYLRDHLKFHLGERQRQAVELFYALAGRHDLAPKGVKLVFHQG